MSIDEALVAAVELLVPEIAPQVYEGKALEYCTYNYAQLPALHAEGRPQAILYLVQLHYCAPRGQNCGRTIRLLSQALFCAGGTWPTVEDASDEDGQHYVLECQYKEALDGED